MKISCPRCKELLVRTTEPPYHLWQCPKCEGQAVTLAVLRKGIAEDFLREAWRNAVRAIGHSSRRCPACTQNMARVFVDELEIEVCRSCQLIWFDRDELDAAPELTAEEQADRRWDREIREQKRRRVRQETWNKLMKQRIGAMPF